jgi:chromosome segregation ATPase
MSQPTPEMSTSSSRLFLTQAGTRPGLGHNPSVDLEMTELEELLAGSGVTNQSALLLKKKKEMREVDDALEFIKVCLLMNECPKSIRIKSNNASSPLLHQEQYQQRMEKCTERRHAFELKQHQMKEQVHKFEKFIQENDAKSARAESKVKQERRALEQKEAEYRLLEKQLEDASLEEEGLRKLHFKMQCHEEFLKLVIQQSDQAFQEIPDILNRYRTLLGANRDLSRQSQEGEETMERSHVEMQQYHQGKQNELLVHNSILNERQRYLEAVRASLKNAMDESEQEADRVKGIRRESGQVVLAIRNLHNRCNQTRSVPDSYEKKDEDLALFLERSLTLIGKPCW